LWCWSWSIFLWSYFIRAFFIAIESTLEMFYWYRHWFCAFILPNERSIEYFSTTEKIGFVFGVRNFVDNFMKRNLWTYIRIWKLNILSIFFSRIRFFFYRMTFSINISAMICYWLDYTRKYSRFWWILPLWFSNYGKICSWTTRRSLN